MEKSYINGWQEGYVHVYNTLDIVAQFNHENIKRSAVRKINNKII